MKKPFFAAAVLLAAPVAAAAAEAFEVYAYGDVGAYRGMFEAVAAMSGQDGYRILIKSVLLLVTSVMLITTAVFKLPAFASWFLQSTVVASLLLSPTSTVAIIDKLNGGGVYTVSNVPLALAAGAALSTKSSFWLTDKWEALLSVPGDMRVSQTGYRFGQKALKTALSSDIRNPVLRSDLEKYFQNCVLLELSSHPEQAEAIFGGGSDSWQAAWDISNPMGVTTITSAAVVKTAGCRDAAIGGSNAGLDEITGEEALKTRVNGEIASGKMIDGKSIRPFLDDASAAAAYEGTLDTVSPVLTKSLLSASQTINQAMFINFWNGSGPNVAAAMGNGSEAQLMLAKTEAQMQAIQSYRVQGKLAEDTLPRFRNMIEMIIIFLFPIMVIYAIAAGDKAIMPLRGWFMGLVWVALWPPLYAVANYFGISHEADALANALSGATSGTQVLGYRQLMEAQMQLAQASADSAVIVLSITAIAGVIAKGFDFAGSGVINNMMSAMTSAGASAGAANAMGNDRIVQGGSDRVSMSGGAVMQKSQAGISMTTNSVGQITDLAGAGVMVKASSSLTKSLDASSKSAHEAAIQHGKEFAESAGAGLAALNQYSKGHTLNLSAAEMRKHGVSSDDARSYRTSADLAQRIQKATGLDARLSADASLGISSPIVTARLSARGSVGKSLLDEISAVDRKTAEGAVRYASALAREQSTNTTESAQDAHLKTTTSTLNRALEARRLESASLRQAESFEIAAKEQQSNSSSIDHDATVRVARKLAEVAGGVDQAKRVLEMHKLGTLNGAELNMLDQAEKVVVQEMLAERHATLQIPAPENNAQGKFANFSQQVAGREQVGERYAEQNRFVTNLAQRGGVDATGGQDRIRSNNNRLEEFVDTGLTRDGQKVESGRAELAGDKANLNSDVQRVMNPLGNVDVSKLRRSLEQTKQATQLQPTDLWRGNTSLGTQSIQQNRPSSQHVPTGHGGIRDPKQPQPHSEEVRTTPYQDIRDVAGSVSAGKKQAKVWRPSSPKEDVRRQNGGELQAFQPIAGEKNTGEHPRLTSLGIGARTNFVQHAVAKEENVEKHGGQNKSSANLPLKAVLDTAGGQDRIRSNNNRLEEFVDTGLTRDGQKVESGRAELAGDKANLNSDVQRVMNPLGNVDVSKLRRSLEQTKQATQLQPTDIWHADAPVGTQSTQQHRPLSQPVSAENGAGEPRQLQQKSGSDRKVQEEVATLSELKKNDGGGLKEGGHAGAGAVTREREQKTVHERESQHATHTKTLVHSSSYISSSSEKEKMVTTQELGGGGTGGGTVERSVLVEKAKPSKQPRGLEQEGNNSGRSPVATPLVISDERLQAAGAAGKGQGAPLQNPSTPSKTV